jgi:hypothetical protein
MDDAAFWGPIKDTGPEFCANLLPFHWVSSLVAICQAVAPVTVVTRSHTPASAHGKSIWLARHGFHRYLIGTTKTACAHAGSVLIDDSDAECDAFAAAGGRAILFPRHWNRMHGFKMDPVRFVRDQLEVLVNPPRHTVRRTECSIR